MRYPLRFAPRYQVKVWGGRRLESLLGRPLPPGERIGESWEVSDVPGEESRVVNGAEQGRDLHDLLRRHGEALLGTRAALTSEGRFPLLVKYIDAEDKLSVQVHPDDAYAARHPGAFGKTEMWYVLHAEPGAELIAGLAPGVTREDFRAALAGGGDPAALLHRLPVKTGDAVFIPAGRIHAILPGLVILEIQQTSDTTFRLYDWGRMGLDGKPRALHVAEALEAANWEDHAPEPERGLVSLHGANRSTRLAACPYFIVDKHDLAGEGTFTADGGSFRILNCVSGEGELAWDGGVEALAPGDTLLVPAALTTFSVRPNGRMSLILSSAP